MIGHSDTFSPIEASTLVDLLRWRAQHQPEQRAFTFLSDGEHEGATLSYGELDRRARSIAAALQRGGVAGSRAILLYPPGLDFITAFFGCLYGGVVAVPAYPPHPARLQRTLPRLHAIMRDAQPSFALTTSSIQASVEGRLELPGELAPMQWLATDGLEASEAEGWQHPNIGGETLAFLQYTSGSTGTPKGVMVSHGNILHNERLIQQAFEMSEQSVIVGWLPLYHDMGLIGNVLQPLYVGAQCILMSPLSFLQRPFSWLQAISRYKGTTSGGPNFAYDLCVNRITPEQRATLDLSHWSLAFNGAEPIRDETLTRFAETFEPYGFRRDAFYPCYGLAEATLFVTGGKKGSRPKLHAPEEGRAFVSCGYSRTEQKVLVVNPASLTPSPAEGVGEIWIAGPSVTQGYWNKPEETERTFRAVPQGVEGGPFLRTGDLGFMKDGELFITGRIKDLIIIRGRNHYPQDIEWTAQQSHPLLRAHACAAFSVEVENQERLVVMAEVEPHAKRAQSSGNEKPENAQAMMEAIRQAVADEHELQAYAVLLLKAGSLPKTTSGKLQRFACREAFLAGTVEALASDILEAAATDEDEFQLDLNVLWSGPPDEQQAMLESYLRTTMARALRVAPSRLDGHQPISAFGLDSLSAIEVKNRIEVDLGLVLPITALLGDGNLGQLATHVLAELTALPSAMPSLVASSASSSAEHPLSPGQQALWFLHNLAPESAAYNITSALLIQGSLDIPALKRAFQALTDRHPALRTTFPLRDGKPVQQVHEHQPVHFEVNDASTWSQQELDARLVEEALRPFELEHGPLLRVSLFARSSSEHVLLLNIHHLVADFWSLQVLIAELCSLYPAEKAQSATTLPALELQYTDYVEWQADLLASPEGERLWQYWQKQLAGELPVINLPADHPRPPVQTYRGASHAVTLDAELTRRLKELAKDESATLYMLLLAAFQVFLTRFTGQEDILVGSPTTGRSRAALSQLIGYFVNPVVLRADLSGNPSFTEFLQQVRQTVSAAFEHQDYPFASLVERLQPQRDASRSPLFQVMFSLQRANSLDETELATFALGEAGGHLNIGDLQLESLALKQRVAQFDLTLMMAETEGGLTASFQYNTDLFEAATVSRMAEHFHALLESVAARPTQAIGSLSMMTESQKRQLSEAWAATLADYPEQPCIQELFELQVERTPESDSVVFEGTRLSYRELNRRANQLAHYLRGLGVGPDVLVGICMERSWEMVVGLLGILKAGGAYVPLDPTYPKDRLTMMLEDSQAPVLLTHKGLAQSFPDLETQVVNLDSERETIALESEDNPNVWTTSEHLAYVIYTSGSTGKPKGVMLQHRSVINFFTGIDSRVGCGPADTMLAVTSISFDISVLELLWTLTRGARVVVLSEAASHGLMTQPRRPAREKPVSFSLFYFASADSSAPEDKYRLLLEGAKFADEHGFEAVWTPERHFHAFGGLYPNPSVTGAALAAVTKNIGIRAGSVVMPLHSPVRVAEEWALVDNLSKGRVGLSFASGWHADDFVFFPDQYADRKEIMYRDIETVQKLWRGDSVKMRGGGGNDIEVKIYPKPVQPALPIWITAAGVADTYIKAGEIGANVLTHLLGQSLEDVVEKIKLYRESRARHGHDPQAGRVTLMLHTYLDTDAERVTEKVRVPFTNYLRTSVGLIANLVRSLNLSLDLNSMSEGDMDALLAFAFDRYFKTSALFGTPDMCREMIERVQEMGVDEVACLIDFGVDADSALASLKHLNELRERCSQQSETADYSLAAQAVRYRATMLQCTPSMMQLLSLNADVMDSLKSLRVLLLGGEALPPSVAKQMKSALPCRLLNMYGPTETTIWSATYEVEEVDTTVSIGQPIANTQIYILDRFGQPAPTGVAGELCIGGDGLARGYLNRAELTGERFIPDPFAQFEIVAGGLEMTNEQATTGMRLYKTGDLARYRADGTIEFLGRLDQQVKIRGFRIELGEIEAVLAEHPGVRETVVVAREDVPGDKRLVAYVVPDGEDAPSIKELRTLLREKLPEYMIPAHFVTLETLPWTANGKINRKALPAVAGTGMHLEAEYVAPETSLERAIALVWQQVLKVEKVGVNDNFFDLGGQSLLMAQAHSQLRDLLQRKDLPLVKMLEHPTVSSLARYLSQTQSEPTTFKQTQDRAKNHRAGLLRQRQTVLNSRSKAL